MYLGIHSVVVECCVLCFNSVSNLSTLQLEARHCKLFLVGRQQHWHFHEACWF